MLSQLQIRNQHLPYCGHRLHKECRVDECECLCHYPELWDMHIEDLENQNYYMNDDERDGWII